MEISYINENVCRVVHNKYSVSVVSKYLKLTTPTKEEYVYTDNPTEKITELAQLLVTAKNKPKTIRTFLNNVEKERWQ